MRASDRAYRTLREEILGGSLEPGTVLAEVEQATRLGVSRTPVREALSRLMADGLVAAQSPRVLVVTEVTAERIAGLYELRQALEAQAASLAARRRQVDPFLELRSRLIDAPLLLDLGPRGIEQYFRIVDDLDTAIDEAVGNPYLTAALNSVRLHSARIRRLASHNHDRLRAAAEEHLMVVEAIVEQDAALAAHATHVHLHKSLRNALSTIEHGDDPAGAAVGAAERERPRRVA